MIPILSKLLEKTVFKSAMPIISEKKLLPTHQFGFQRHHSTIDQIHRITDFIENTFEEKNVCSAVFPDVAQAFDKVWHEGLIHKLRGQLPKSYCDFLSSYITERYFRVKQQDSYSEFKFISACVPQGSILGPN